MMQPTLHVGADQSPRRGEHERVQQAFDAVVENPSAAGQRVRAAQRLAALGEMTGGIAHDFRNLLAVIESGLRLAERSSEQPEKVRAYIAAAREGIDRGVELTSQLLAFAKHQELGLPPSGGRGKSNALLAGVRRSTLRVTRVRAVSSAI